MIALLLLWLPGQTTNAQYLKVLKGQPSPFDTAVVVEINQYRLETARFKLCDTLLVGLTREAHGYKQTIQMMKETTQTDQLIIAAHQAQHEKDQREKERLRQQLQKALKPPKGVFLKNPITWGLLGFVAGVLAF